MNKRLSMDKGAWQAYWGPTRADGIQSVADYTHRLREINEVAGTSCGKVGTGFPRPTMCLSKKEASDCPQKWPPLLGPMLGFQRPLGGPFDAFCGKQSPHPPRMALFPMPADLNSPETTALLTRIADALERLAPMATPHADVTVADAF